VAIPEEDTATPVFLELYWSKDESLWSRKTQGNKNGNRGKMGASYNGYYKVYGFIRQKGEVVMLNRKG
jgi:hypothetical protein